MKILDIRFKNLNSLRGEWHIDLRNNAYVNDGIFAITGPTGAGKTTIFNIITGVYTPSAGRVYFNGADITPLKAYQINKLGIARTFQNLR
ncbi:MAG: AAA family ATPase, partial [Synergistaceae bacterium]|nr:AAA family ATPase [Synergistaceae bacterium]